MNPLEPRAIIEAAHLHGKCWECYLAGAGEMLKRIMGDKTREVCGRTTEARLTELVNQYHAFTRAAETLARQLGPKTGTPTTEPEPATTSVAESGTLNRQHPPLPRTVP